MIGVIARKELLELWRDGRFRTAALLLIALLVAAEAFGWRNYLDLSQQAQQASHDERERWLGQGNKYPHGAAHYGVFAFKAPRPLAILDSGIQPYVGASVWLEAHKQNDLLYRPAEDATALQRFGDLTVATVGQALLPLLIIFMGFAAFAGEREEGTLKQLVLLGLKPSELLLGKAAGQAAALAVALVPAFLLTFAVVAVLEPVSTLSDELIRAVGFAAVYSVYLGGFLFLTLAVSASCSSSKTALLVCLAFWALSVLAAPRFLMDTAKRLYPTEPALELKHSLDASLRKNAAEAWKKREAELLKEYRVSRKEDLPIAFEGIELQVDEAVKYRLFEDHYGAFFDTLRRQNRLYQFGTLIAPVTGLQLLSMALAGNDLEQHRDFILQGEANRRVIHTMINDFMVKNSVRTAEGEWEIEAGRELWQRIPPFEYQPTRWPTVLAQYGLGLGLLLLWTFLSLAYALLAVNRLWIQGARA